MQLHHIFRIHQYIYWLLMRPCPRKISKTEVMGSEMSLFFYFFFPLFPLLVMRQGPFYLGEDTFKEPKGKMIFYQCLSLFTFVCLQRRMIIAIYCMIQVHCL